MKSKCDGYTFLSSENVIRTRVDFHDRCGVDHPE